MRRKLPWFIAIVMLLTACASAQANNPPTPTDVPLPGTSTPLPLPTATAKTHPTKATTVILTAVPPKATPTAYDGVKINSKKYSETDCAKDGSAYVAALGNAGPTITDCLPIDRTKYNAVHIKVVFNKNESEGSDPNVIYLLDKGKFDWMNSSTLFRTELFTGTYTATGFCDDICDITLRSTNGFLIEHFEVESVGDFTFPFEVKYDFTSSTTMAEVLVEHTDNYGDSYFDLTISPAGNLVTTP